MRVGTRRCSNSPNKNFQTAIGNDGGDVAIQHNKAIQRSRCVRRNGHHLVLPLFPEDGMDGAIPIDLDGSEGVVERRGMSSDESVRNGLVILEDGHEGRYGTFGARRI